MRIRIRDIWVKVAELFNANVHFLIVFLDILDAGFYLINLRIFLRNLHWLGPIFVVFPHVFGSCNL